uniref:A-kinase anchor protein 7-like phosphoesterase domain-containing protein n=1 Tax=Meleagris gallopavo TaxID=9103 RepID=G1NKG2_MELGA
MLTAYKPCVDVLLVQVWYSTCVAVLMEAGVGSQTDSSVHEQIRCLGRCGPVKKEEDYWKGSSRRQGEERKKKKKQYQPNYFISLPITNPEIAGNVRAVQDAIIQKDDRLSKAMVHCGSLHVTMLVMHLSSKEEISIAIGALSDSKDFVEDLLKGRTVDLSFQGIDHFKNEVGFVQLAENDHTAILSEIAETMRKIFQEKGILAGEERAFKPHLTFMKLSKSTQLRKQVSSHFR